MPEVRLSWPGAEPEHPYILRLPRWWEPPGFTSQPCWESIIIVRTSLFKDEQSVQGTLEWSHRRTCKLPCAYHNTERFTSSRWSSIGGDKGRFFTHKWWMGGPHVSVTDCKGSWPHLWKNGPTSADMSWVSPANKHVWEDNGRTPSILQKPP